MAVEPTAPTTSASSADSAGSTGSAGRPRPVEHPDTVADAAATPEREMPYAELGLKDDEYASIKSLLGRRPTSAELAMYSVMWSEHCSYKSSKIHLRQFGEKTTPEMREHLLVGMGENAGVVDIGDGWAVTFKVESHNHPSFVEPYQGAATGVGGIVRDIVSMGARPVAVMDQLRFGDVGHADTARVVHGVVAGVGVLAHAHEQALAHLGRELAAELLEVDLRGLVRAVLGPHHRVHCELGRRGAPAEDLPDVRVFVLFETELGPGHGLLGRRGCFLDGVIAFVAVLGRGHGFSCFRGERRVPWAGRRPEV